MMIQIADKILCVIVIMLISTILIYKYMSIVHSVHKDNEQQKKLDRSIEAYFEYLERTKERRKNELPQLTQHLKQTTK